MKKIYLVPFFVMVITSYSAQAQTSSILLKDTFTVYGNCEMCKKNIETSVQSLPGVAAVFWNLKNQLLTIAYDSSKVGIDTLHTTISLKGYKTSLLPANVKGYQALPFCCKVTNATKPPKALK